MEKTKLSPFPKTENERLPEACPVCGGQVIEKVFRPDVPSGPFRENELYGGESITYICGAQIALEKEYIGGSLIIRQVNNVKTGCKEAVKAALQNPAPPG